jgi:hypothetical protein
MGCHSTWWTVHLSRPPPIRSHLQWLGLPSLAAQLLLPACSGRLVRGLVCIGHFAISSVAARGAALSYFLSLAVSLSPPPGAGFMNAFSWYRLGGRTPTFIFFLPEVHAGHQRFPRCSRAVTGLLLLEKPSTLQYSMLHQLCSRFSRRQGRLCQ